MGKTFSRRRRKTGSSHRSKRLGAPVKKPKVGARNNFGER